MRYRSGGRRIVGRSGTENQLEERLTSNFYFDKRNPMIAESQVEYLRLT